MLGWRCQADMLPILNIRISPPQRMALRLLGSIWKKYIVGIYSDHHYLRSDSVANLEVGHVRFQ